MGRAETTQEIRRKAAKKSKIIHQGSMIRLRHDEIYLPEDQINKYDVIEHPGAVVILPIQPAGLVLIRQYRYPIDQVIYELPAGRLEPGENPEIAAQRELREETGFSASKLNPIGSFYMAPGYTNELLHFFIATDLQENGLTAEDTDQIDVTILSLSKTMEMIKNNSIIDAKTVIGVFLYQKWYYEKLS